MLYEDLEMIVNGVHLMTEDEIEEFIQTRSPAKQALGVFSNYADRKRTLLRQRETPPKKRKEYIKKAAQIKKAGGSVGFHKDPEEERKWYK